MRNVLLLLLLALEAVLLPAQTSPAKATQDAEQPIKTTLCAIKANPAAFQHKLVQVSGIASHGFEESLFEDLSCFWTVKSAPGIWMEYGGTVGTDTMYCCGATKALTKEPLVVDGISVPLQQDDLFTRFSSMLRTPTPGGVSVRATVQARIFARLETVGQNRKLWGGYGHMGCCILLAIQRVVSLDSDKAGPSVFSLVEAAAKLDHHKGPTPE